MKKRISNLIVVVLLIVSWNFKHLINIKTIQGVRKITQLKGYKDIEIMNPTTLLEMEV